MKFSIKDFSKILNLNLVNLFSLAFNLVLAPWCVFEAMELEPLKQMRLT